MARVNIDILGTSELKWTGLGEFNSDDHYMHYCEQESLISGTALIVKKRVWNAAFRCDIKNERVITVCFQGKPFNIMAIKVYASATNTKEAEVDWFCEKLQDFLELTP